MSRRVLLVAAEFWELKYVPPRDGWEMVAAGPGPALAAGAVREADAIVSVGLCGALEAALQVGDVVVGSAVNGTRVDVPRYSRRAATGPIISVDRVAASVAEKRHLAQGGAIAVEMEAAGVLQAAARMGRPFYCIKAVSDTADEGFELDLNAARDRSGRFRVSRIVAQAMRRPVTLVPELLRLNGNSKRATKALGEFLGDCSF